MTTLKVALDRLIALSKRASWGLPSIVRLGSLITAWHWAAFEKLANAGLGISCGRRRAGSCGIGSGCPVDEFVQAGSVAADLLRKERSSRKKISRFLPQR